MMPNLDLTFRTGKPHERFLRARVREAMAHVRHCPAEVSIALVGDTTMAKLHEQFLSIPGPTDVLTFELEHDARGRCVSGEIVICVPYAARTARKLGTPLRHELLLYCVHGLLHLTGHDDRDDISYRRMHKEEDRILTRIGIGPVFHSQKPEPTR
jgi:probable rRNA maturation factor